MAANDVGLGDLEAMRGGWKLPHPEEEVYRFEIGTDLGGAVACLRFVRGGRKFTEARRE